MITFAGTELSMLDARIVRDAPSTYAERDVEVVEVPGRNGALVFDNGAFKNVSAEYTMYIPSLDKRRTARQVAAWLLSHADGYYRLYDDYEPDVYRMARFVGPLDVEARLERYGTAKLTFDCKPQRYLLDDDELIVYPVVGGYVNSNGGMEAGDTLDRRTGYIPVSAGSEITVTIDYEYEPDDQTTGVVFASYSAPGTHVSQQRYTPTAPGATTYTYTVPSGANYVIVAWKSGYSTVVIETPSSSATYSQNGPIINNDTLFDAAPLVRLRQGPSPTVNVQGFAIGDTRVSIVMTGQSPAIYNDGIVVDCESMTTYAEYVNDIVSLNARTTVYDTSAQREADAFPVFAPGANVLDTVNATGGMASECPVTEIVIDGRWWTV